MTLSKKPERDCDSMEVRLYNRGWNAAIDAITPPSPPPQRTWVGLTDEETGHWAADFLAGAKWAEAKLKEKNA